MDMYGDPPAHIMLTMFMGIAPLSRSSQVGLRFQ